jgi:hypothetical protein
MFLNSLKSTVLIENLGNLGRRIERENGSGKLCPKTAWHRFAHSRLMRDFECPLMEVTCAAKAAAPSDIADSFIYADEDSCDIPDDLLDTIHENNASWPAQSPQQRRITALRFRCAFDFVGDWAKINSA